VCRVRPSVFTTPITVSIREKNGKKERKKRNGGIGEERRKGGTRGVSTTSNVQCPSTYRAVPTVQSSAGEWSGEMCGVLRYSTVCCGNVMCRVLFYTTSYCVELYFLLACFDIIVTARLLVILHCTALHCTALHCSAQYKYTLSYVTMHY
jgi:hypothetical protein